jgi:hypothetical protein
MLIFNPEKWLSLEVEGLKLYCPSNTNEFCLLLKFNINYIFSGIIGYYTSNLSNAFSESLFPYSLVS